MVSIDGREKAITLTLTLAIAIAKNHGKREGYAVIDRENDSSMIEKLSERKTDIYTHTEF